MYWATGFANELSLQSCSNGKKHTSDLEKEENSSESTVFPQSLDIVAIQPSSQAAFFVSCTRSSIQLWSVKVVHIKSSISVEITKEEDRS
jgi:hypothetical protein